MLWMHHYPLSPSSAETRNDASLAVESRRNECELMKREVNKLMTTLEEKNGELCFLMFLRL